jgi:hypothetical protein
MEPTYEFSGALWEHGGENTWVFITLPGEHADEIADLTPRRPGFGSVKVQVRIGETEWATSLFPDKSLGSYVLPVKRSVRDREQLAPGDVADVTIRVILK